jgi:hypothetical protein
MTIRTASAAAGHVAGHTVRATLAAVVRRAAYAGAIGVLLTGCDQILDVDNPDIVDPERLGGPEAIPTVYAGAVGDFAVAYAGSAQPLNVVTATGLLTDEFFHSGTSDTEQELDRRAVTPFNLLAEAVFRNLHTARRAAETAVNFIEENAPDPESDARVAELHNFVGFTYVLAGETFCSGVPFSRVQPGGGFEFGAPLSTSEMFAAAVAVFDTALTKAGTAGATTQELLARVGRARAQLDLGQFAEAAATVAPVPTDFSYAVTYSQNTPRQNNSVHGTNAVAGSWSLAHQEGGNGLPLRGTDPTDPAGADPRAPWTVGGVGLDNVTPLYVLLKYPSLDAPVVLADGVEARLIEAEAALRAGDAATFSEIHNALRATIGLPPSGDPGTTDGRVDLHFSERAFWLLATGHRLGDLRRLVRQYGREPETVFPTGPYFKSGTYETGVNVPVPESERNNPQFTGCIGDEA